jgi:hypothetical protein
MSSETINPANAPQLEKSKSLGVAKIESKEVYITGANHNRGQPTQYTPKHLIGEDGKTDYYTIKVETPVDLEYKEEGKIPIDTFFVTETIYQQIERIPNALEGLKNGARFGPVKALKRKSQKTGNPYWVLAFESDADY